MKTKNIREIEREVKQVWKELIKERDGVDSLEVFLSAIYYLPSMTELCINLELQKVKPNADVLVRLVKKLVKEDVIRHEKELEEIRSEKFDIYF